MARMEGWWSGDPLEADDSASAPATQAATWWEDDPVEAPPAKAAPRSPMPAFDEMGQPTVPEPPAQVAVIPEPAPFVAQDERSTAGAVGRQVARGAIETAALVPKGAAALGYQAEGNVRGFGDRQLEVMNRIDRGEAVPDQEDAAGYQYMNPAQRARARAEAEAVVRANAANPQTPIEQRQTFKAGEAIDEYGRTRFPTTKAEDEAFWTGQVPRALGSTVAMAPVALAGAPFGALGRLMAGVGLATTGSGEAAQAAVDRRRQLEDMVRAGDAPSPDAYPSDRQIATAAGQGLAPGALDAAAIDNLLRPVVRVPGFRGLIAAVAKKAIEQGIVEGTTEGVQQVMQNLIAQHGYNPDQGVLEQVAENVLVGGAVGVLTGGLAGGMIRPRRGDAQQAAVSAPQPVLQQEIPPDVSRETAATTPPIPAAAPPIVDGTPPIDATGQPGQTPDTSAPVRPSPTPEDLQAVLDDPRPVAEIMAERERQAARTATIAAVEQEDGPDAAAAVAKVMDGAGQRRTPMRAETAADVDMAAAQAQQPTPAQAEAGNYRKGHVTVQGLDIAIEVPRGGERAGIGPDGRPWSVQMPAHYGYLKAGKDSGDGKVDVFVGDFPEARYAYVIDQIDPATGKFDEPKVMLGMNGEGTAAATYEMSYSDGSGPARMGAITRMTVAEMKAWLRDGNPKKPLAYVPGPAIAAPAAADAWASDPIVQPAPAALPNNPLPSSEPRPASTVPLGGQTAAPSSAGFPSPGPMPTTVAPQDPVAQARAFAAQNKIRLSNAEMVDVRELVAEGVDPEEAVEIALTRSGLAMADEIVAATEEVPYEAQAQAEPARDPGEVPAQEGQREEPADARAEAGRAPQGEQPRGAEQSAPAAEPVAEQPAPKDAIDSALDAALDEQFGEPQAKAAPAKRDVPSERAQKAKQEQAPAADRSGGTDWEQWWDRDLTGAGRRRAMEAAGVRSNGGGLKPDRIQWRHLTSPDHVKLQALWRSGWDPDTAPAAPEAKAPRAPRTAGQATTSAAKNAAAGLGEATTALVRLFGAKPNRLTSGIGFDEATYREARPHFVAALRHFQAAAGDIAEAARALVRHLAANGLDRAGIEAMRPYLSRFLGEVRDGGVDLDPATIQAEASPKENGDGNGRTGSVEGPGAAPLGEVAAESGARTESGEDAGQGTERRGEDDARRDAELDEGGRDPGRGVGSDAKPAPVPAAGERRPKLADADKAAEQRADHEIEASDAIGDGGQIKKYNDNIVAIRLLKDLERAGVPANVEQKKLLARYVGWGGIKSAFPGRDERNSERWNKGWEERGTALRNLLTPDEYDAARRSILNAHYTSETVVRAMYDMVARLGFTGGSVLEPSMGTGNFFGMMPRALRGTTRRTGIELDAITGGIAKHLYSESNILAPMGFQEAPLADNHFDLAIGNPPFGAEPVPGAKEEYRRFSIHNYFFARTIDKVRPGGLMMMIVTSRYLDTRGRDQRNYVADRAELVGAIRLPNTAFQKNAGTEVTTDILIFRKLPESARGTADKSWMETDTVPDPLGGEPIEISAYFKANPEMMLGRMERSGTMYAKGEPTLAPDDRDLAEALRAAVARLPEDVYQPSTIDVPALVAASGEGPKASEAASDYDVGSYFIDGDAVFRRDASPDGSPVATKLTAETPWTEKQTLGETRLARIRGLIRVREAAREVLSLEASDAPDAKVDKARAALNDAYDQFVKEHGFVSERANETIFADDPDAPLLLALESDFDPGVTRSRARALGVEFRKPRAAKASIFTSRVIPRYTPIVHAENATDALAASLADKASVDLAHMAQLTGKSEQSIIAELHDDLAEPLIFRDPHLDRWVTADEYLSGNVKRKAAQAKAAGLDKNLAALKAVFPKDLTAGEIRARIGAPWIKPEYYVAFARHLLGEGTEGRAIYLPATGGFSASFSAGDNLADVERWGTHRLGGADLLERLMNQREIIVRDRQPDDSTVINREETDKAVAKAQAIRDEWESWLMRDADRREDLVAYYNANYNTDVAPKFDGSHMALPGKTPTIKLRRHQINAIWRGVLARTVLLDHVVGAGKTFTMIAQAMEMRRIGLARKPMLVVPNHLVQQWATDFYRLYPGAKILAMGKADFEKSNRKRMLARIATGNWDAVITAHSTFGFMGVSPETEASFIQQQIDELDATISAVMAQNGNKKNRSASQLEKQKQRLEAKLAELLERPRDDLLTFEQIGVDQLFVDEAHEFKNLFFSTARRGLLGLGNPQGSKKAFDMFVKVRYLLGKQAGKGVVFATGTPVSNSLSELYTLQRYLGLENLRDRGIHSFDGWMNAFGVDEAKHEIDSTGNRYKQVTRLRRLTNVGEIIAFYRQFADSVTLDRIKANFAEDNPGKEFPVPKVKGGGRQGIVVKRSEAQARFFAALVKRAEKLKSAGRPEKGADNMLSITSDARKAALDMRLVYPGASDNPAGKTTMAAGRIFDIWKRSTDDRGTQLVFLDLSTPAKQARKEGPKAIKAAIEAAGDPQTPAGFASLPLDEQWVWARDKVYETLNREGDDDAADKAREKAQRFIDNEMSEAEAAVTTAATGFSVYDDIRAKLIERGVPEAEIAFIHDYGTDDRKADLFDQVNAGRIRILLGSTAKMGAGTNVQRRIVALHHIDTPWRPSDIEQREGRAIRQGNELLEKYGKDFEVEILSYATELTYDARMWGVQEGKIIAIDSLRHYSGQREIEEVSPEAASAAELKAAASGNPLILEDVQLTEKVNKLGSERRAHERSQWDLEDRQRRNQRLLDDAERLEAMGDDAKTAREYLDGIAEAVRTKGTIDGKTYETFAAARDAAQAAIAEQKGGSERAAWSLDVNGKKITSQEALATALTDTWGDASSFRVEIDGKAYISRRLAARKIHKGEAKSEASGTIGGFKFTIEIEANKQGVINPWTREASIELVGKTTHAEMVQRLGKEKVDGDTIAVAALRRLDEMIAGIGPAYDDRTKAVEKARAEQSEIKGMLGKPWARAEELAKAQERLTEVRRLLTETEKKDETTAETEEDGDDVRYQMAQPDSARLRVAGEIDATVNLTPKDAAQRDAVANAVRVTLRRMVGKAAPDASVFDSMMVGEQEVTGAYSPASNLIAVSLRSPDPIGTVRHETIHVLRQLGLIDDAAWSALTQAAETGGWLDKHSIDERWGEGLTREQALEEAIAEEFGVGLREGVWKTGNAKADAIFQRIAEFFRRVRSEIKRALAATGLRDMTDADVAELVFSLIERGAFREGEISAREPQGAMAQGSGDDRTAFQMAAAGARQAANTPQPRRMRTLRAAISALRGGDAVDPLAKVRVPNDIGWARKTTVTPRTIAAYFPAFADAFFAGTRQFQARDMSISELTEIARPYLDLEQASKDKVAKVIEHGRMAGEVYTAEPNGTIVVENKVGQQVRGKIGGVTLMANGETVTLDAKEVDAYRAYRAVMDRALDKFRDQVVREWGFDPNAAGAPKTAEDVDDLARNSSNAGERARLKTLSTVLGSIETAKRRGYVPFTRYGSHYVTVTSMQDGRSVVVHREHIEPGLTSDPKAFGPLKRLTIPRLEQQAAALRARLAEIYPPRRGFQISELREVTPASFDDIPDFSDLDAIIAAANLPPDQSAAVQQALGEVIQKRGFRAHFIKSRNIPGYSVDFERSLADYIVGISGYLARREHLPEIEDAIASIPATQPELRRYAKDWNDYIQNPSEEWNGLRQAGFLWYLSGRLSSALVNLSQVPMVTAPYLSMFASPVQASAEIARAYKDAGLAIRPKPKSMGGAGLDFFDPDALPADVREAVKKAIADGTLLPIETFQEMARAQGKTPKSRSIGAKAKTAQDAAAFMFQAAERTNRLVSFIAAYRLAQRPEVMGRIRADLRDNPLWTRRTKERRQDAATFAAFVVEETQFLLGKINRTKMMRGPGSVIFQFKAFAANYIELMARLGAFGSGVHRGGRNYAALAGMAFALFMVGGLLGLPGAEDGLEMIEALIQSMTGVDPQLERGLRETAGSLAAWAARQLGAGEEAQDTVSRFTGRVVARGVAREAGVDVSQRIGQGRFVPKPTGTEHDSYWYRTIGLAGIPGSWVLRGIDAASALARGDLLQAGIRLAPEAIADIGRASQLATDGVRTIAKGRQVMRPDETLPDGTTVGGAANVAKRALGFQPTGISRAREQMNAVRRAGEAPRDLFSDFNLRRANIQAALNRADEAVAAAKTPAAREAAQSAVRREAARMKRVMDEVEAYNAKAPSERQYKLKNPGYAQQLKTANQGQMETQIKKVPMRVRGGIEDIRARF